MSKINCIFELKLYVIYLKNNSKTMETEITKEFLESLNLSIDEVNDLFSCENCSQSIKSGECSFGQKYYYAGYSEIMICSDSLLLKKLIQPYDEKIMTINDKNGWYLTELGYDVIQEIIKLHYEPYLENWFFQNDYIKKNVEHVRYCCNHMNFTLLNNSLCEFVSFDIASKQLDYIYSNIGWNIGNLNNLEDMIKKLEELSSIVKKIQQQLNSFPKEKSFIEIYKEKK